MIGIAMMKRLLLVLVVALSFITSVPALAQFVTPVQMRDSNLTLTNTQNLISTLNTFTAQRTLTIPGAGSMNSYYLQFVDTANAINGSNTLRIIAADGSLINGSAALTVNQTGVYVFIIPSPSGYSATIVSTSPGGITQLTGDVTAGPGTGSQVATLATVNANVGAFGSNVQCTSITVNGKGLITAAAQTACAPPITAVTGLGTGIATALAINVGTAGAPILFNGNAGTPSALVLTNATGLPIGSITGLGAGCATWLATPTSANLRGCISDETGTGLAYFQGGALGTPASGTGTNITGIPPANLTTGTQDTVLGYWGSTAASAIAINNCVSALTYSTATHTFGCNASAGSGDVVGPASSTANGFAVFNGTTGKLIKDHAATIALGSEVSGTLPVANGGTGDTGTAWSAYTPTLSCASGTLTTTSSSGRYKTLGKTTFITINAVITTVGTCATALIATLPNTATSATVLAGRESAITGKSVAGFAGGLGNTVSMTFYDNTVPAANGYSVFVSGVYENQ